MNKRGPIQLLWPKQSRASWRDRVRNQVNSECATNPTWHWGTEQQQVYSQVQRLFVISNYTSYEQQTSHIQGEKYSTILLTLVRLFMTWKDEDGTAETAVGIQEENKKGYIHQTLVFRYKYVDKRNDGSCYNNMTIDVGIYRLSLGILVVIASAAFGITLYRYNHQRQQSMITTITSRLWIIWQAAAKVSLISELLDGTSRYLQQWCSLCDTGCSNSTFVIRHQHIIDPFDYSDEVHDVCCQLGYHQFTTLCLSLIATLSHIHYAIWISGLH